MRSDAIETQRKAISFARVVPEKDRGRRLDQFLSESDLNLSRSQAKNLIEKMFVLLNGRSAKPSAHINPGDVVSGNVPAPEPLSLKPEPSPLSVIYEDSSIIVIDKPAGLVVHPAPGNPSGTLVNALLNHCADLGGINGVLRPGIVHRLDKETSGVMVVAKDDQAYQQLTRQFKNRTVEKVYMAIVQGRFNEEEGVIDAEIGRHRTERKRMSTRTRKGREAITRWKRIENLNNLTLLEVYPRTGRTHQIRVHFSSIGHPILGDPVYGTRPTHAAGHTLRVRECFAKLGRLALHAHRLTIDHPETGQRVQFLSPIPRDMSEFLRCLNAADHSSATAGIG